ncbi:MAG: hypothetical protein IT165_16100 [Bryobacterales bacterium]|nr:hypothetical protein [Bryobacterales bacterium]
MIDPVTRKLAAAPIDDEPETEEERRAVEQSKEWLRQRGGKGIPHEEVLRDFGLSADDFHRMAHGKNGLNGPLPLPCGYRSLWRDSSSLRKAT